MAKKKIETFEKVEKKEPDKVIISLADIKKSISDINKRIDSIVEAIDKSKKVKGL